MIDKAIKRLTYTVKNRNKINNSDVTAFNEIVRYINDDHKNLLNNYHLFGKLFVNVFTNDLINNNGNYQGSLYMLKNILKMDLSEHYETFFNETNQIAFRNFSKEIGINQKHPAMLTEKERDENTKLIANNADELAKTLTHYKRESVYNRLNDLILNLIEDYDV